MTTLDRYGYKGVMMSQWIRPAATVTVVLAAATIGGGGQRAVVRNDAVWGGTPAGLRQAINSVRLGADATALQADIEQAIESTVRRLTPEEADRAAALAATAIAGYLGSDVPLAGLAHLARTRQDIIEQAIRRIPGWGADQAVHKAKEVISEAVCDLTDHTSGNPVVLDALRQLHRELIEHGILEAALDERQRDHAASYPAEVAAWADEHWPPDTPTYFLSGPFVRALAADPERQEWAVELVLDPYREERLLNFRYGGREQMQQLSSVALACRDTWIDADTSLYRIARVLARLDTLKWRYRALPTTLPAIYAALGDPDKALGLADAVDEPLFRAESLAHIGHALGSNPPSDQARHAATTAVTDAVITASAIIHTSDRDYALSRVVALVAASHRDEAAEAALTITSDTLRTRALADVAAAVSAAAVGTTWGGSERADEGSAEDLTRAVAAATTDDARDELLAELSFALAASDPDQATDVALRITDGGGRAESLTEVAEAVLMTDPDRAGLLAEQALTSAAVDAKVLNRDEALAQVAPPLALSDPAWAIDVATGIRTSRIRAEGLANVAASLSGADPERGAEVARAALATAREVSGWNRNVALRSVAVSLAATFPDLAREAASEIADSASRAEALAKLAATVAITDPEEASRLADQAVAAATGPSRAHALATIAAELASVLPEQAVDAASRIVAEAVRATALARIAAALAPTASDRATQLADQALMTASNADAGDRDHALGSVAGTLARTHPTQSSAALRGIADARSRAEVTAQVAIEDAESPADATAAALANRCCPARSVEWIINRFGTSAVSDDLGRLVARSWVETARPWAHWSVIPGLCPTNLSHLIALANQ